PVTAPGKLLRSHPPSELPTEIPDQPPNKVLLGAIDLDSGAGAVFLVPGGLSEVVLPLLLIFKGFRSVEQRARTQGNRSDMAPDSPGG
ncbi:hypothetical protein, partial [Streptomyces sp. NPDC017529]|uniref:hypothetical protein n=1 Tax=Streptomyces sp. NPDC017529 TaxID=3365000 RepID=UPI0037BC3869